MGRWQRKILLSLIVYFAGFGTAIYVLAPAEQRVSLNRETQQGSPVALAGLDGDEVSRFKDAIRLGFSKCKSFAEDQSVRAAEFFRQQMDKKQDKGG